MVYVYILVLLISSVYSSDSSNSLLDIDDSEFWKSISDSIPSQSENEELFKIIQKSLCGESLTLVFFNSGQPRVVAILSQDRSRAQAIPH